MNKLDLFFLAAITNESVQVNIPFAVAHFLVNRGSGRRGDSPMVGGVMVTKIGEYLGISKTAGGRLTVVPPHKDLIDGQYFVKAGILVKRNGILMTLAQAATFDAQNRMNIDNEEQRQEGEVPDLGQGQPGGGFQHQGSMPYGQGYPSMAGTSSGQPSSHGAAFDALFGVVSSGFERLGYEMQEMRQHNRWERHQWEIVEHKSLGIPEGYRMTPYPEFPTWTPGAVPPHYDPYASYQSTYHEPWNPAWMGGPSQAQHHQQRPEPTNEEEDEDSD